MAFLIDQIKEQKILEMEVNFDDFIKENKISEDAIIHKMEFDKTVFKEEKEVREYLKDKCFYNPAINEADDKFIAVLISPSQVDLDTEVKVELRRGVQSYAADLQPVMSFDEVRFNEKGEVNLSAKFGTINLSEGLPHIIEIARVAEGYHPSYGKLKITQNNLESMVTNFKSNVTGVDLAVNEDHKKNEAFGWLKDVYLSFDKQTLYGMVQWNAKGTTALSEKEYRYFSPEFRFNYVHPHDDEKVEHGATLLGGALTNYPFLKMEAIVELNNKNNNSQGVKPVEKTIELSIHENKVVELNGKINDIQGKLDVTTNENVELSNKVKKLEDEIALSAKKSANEKLFNEGKMNAAQLKHLNEGGDMAGFIALNEGMVTKPKGSDVKPEDDLNIELSDKEAAVADSLGLTKEEYVNFNK